MHAMFRHPLPCSLVVALCACLAARARASHHVFSSSVDRFEADGNVFGPAGGALDFVDEFDDGTIAPEWSQLLGTAVEAGGVVQLRDPGSDENYVGLALDVSNIENENALQDGAGDFAGTSYWLPALPGPDLEFHFKTYGLGPTIEAAGLEVTNYSATTVAAHPELVAGPAITHSLARINGGGFYVVQSSTVSISPASIIGEIALRLSFDDATNMLSGSFSLDGGATFQSPFAAVPIFVGLTQTELLLGAGSDVDTSPPPPPRPPVPVATKVLSVKDRSGPASRQVIYKVKSPVSPSDFNNSQPEPGASLKVTIDGTTQCFSMPGSGWKLSPNGLRSTYKDKTGAHGPVKLADLITRDGVLRMSVAISGKLGQIDLVPPNPGTQGDTYFHYLNGTAVCGTTAGGRVIRNDAIMFRTEDAPAPTSCALTACEP